MADNTVGPAKSWPDRTESIRYTRAMIRITDTICVDPALFSYSATRASGPGGQHVNRTESAVQLQFDVHDCPAIRDGFLTRLTALAGSRISAAGVITLREESSRSQHRNREMVTNRLIDMLKKAAIPPKPRRKTRPGKGAVQRRLDSKKQRSQTKQSRGKVSLQD